MSAPGFVSPPRLLANSPRRRRQLVSLTPLIDLVFILLVFFMLASSFLDWRSITLDTPAAATGGSASEAALVIELRREGPSVAGELLSEQALVTRVQDYLGENPGERMFLRPAEGVTLQETIALLDRLTGLGAENLSLLRDRQGP